MLRRNFLKNAFLGGTFFSAGLPGLFWKKNRGQLDYDVVIVGGTPGGIMSGIAAARMGKKALILERTQHIGGLPANGLGATDINTRGATAGLFLEFVQGIKQFYVDKYGENSPQVEDCSEGYHFEPAVAEKVFLDMIDRERNLEVRYEYQFDPLKEKVRLNNETIESIEVLNIKNGTYETFRGKVFIDATYEGDLIAAAGVPYRVGREGYDAFEEPYAGRVYKYWNGPSAEGSTLLGDNSIQAYNYRLCLTNDPDIMMKVEKPDDYNREEYVSMIEDIKTGWHTGYRITELTEEQIQENRRRVANGKPPIVPGMPQGIWRITNMVKIPNNKNDANNQHLAFISTDLPEENWPWPTSSWDWRDQFAYRLKNYTLGLIWFAQNDPELPGWFKKETRKWGLAKTEYPDNDHFPRQVYVREGRRMEGTYFFTAHDALPEFGGGRPPVHATSITASHYAIDSHAVRKREPGRVHLDGFLNYRTRPYTVPYGVMLPKEIKNLLGPVPVSGSHLGFSTLRMEPCWMAMGQAAGAAASLSIDTLETVQDIDTGSLQLELLKQNAVLIYFEDVPRDDPDFDLVQFMGLNGILTAWTADLDLVVTESVGREWSTRAGVMNLPIYAPGETSRREYLRSLYQQMKEL